MAVTNDICKALLNLLADYNEVENCLTGINPALINTVKEICVACRRSKFIEDHKLKINSVVDYLHEELHTGHWSSVPVTTKKAFFATSFLKAVILLYFETTSQILSEAMKCIDMGILLGAPLDGNRDLLTNSVKIINEELAKSSNPVNVNPNNRNKRKLEYDIPEYDKIKAVPVARSMLPSLESFMRNNFNPQFPCVIQDLINHWPALRKWTNINYLLTVAGARTVPIEIGSQYSDPNWTQKLMTFRDYIQKYYLQENDEPGYLAQHNLLDQIPELQNDISIPEYCYHDRHPLEDSDNSALEINAWIGPKGTISSLHHDPKDNLLAQVYGSKLVLMFSPADSEYLRPHESQMLCNTSQINPLDPNLDVYPEFLKAKMFKCLLGPGEVLYIPPKWWHYVVALEKSFSVNFWW